jgi:hypothetical protein
MRTAIDANPTSSTVRKRGCAVTSARTSSIDIASETTMSQSTAAISRGNCVARKWIARGPHDEEYGPPCLLSERSVDEVVGRLIEAASGRPWGRDSRRTPLLGGREATPAGVFRFPHRLRRDDAGGREARRRKAQREAARGEELFRAAIPSAQGGAESVRPNRRCSNDVHCSR